MNMNAQQLIIMAVIGIVAGWLASVLVGGPGSLLGYLITGRAGGRGYLQRLAVHPDAQRRGLGSTLVVDGLRWLRRHRCQQAVVNTQETNASALAMYEHLGFRRQQDGLAVLTRATGAGP